MMFAGAYPWEYFLSIPMEDACITLLEAKKRRNDELLFARWIIGHYDYEVSLDEFKNELKPKPKRSAQSILQEVDGYIEQFSSHGVTRVDQLDGN